MADLPKCNHEVFKNGNVVAMAIGKAVDIENLVVYIREFTDINIDWNFAGGRGIVRVLGPKPDVAQRLLVAKAAEFNVEIYL